MKAIPVTSMVLLAALSLISSRRTTEPEKTLSSTTGALAQTQLIDCTKYLPYSPDSNHIWNRVQNSMLLRTGFDGSKWGCDEVDPLLWLGSKHVLVGAKYKETVELLHEFLNSHGERLVRDPLARALFQRNLIAVFHWAAQPISVGDVSRAEEPPNQDQSLKCCAECRGNYVGCYKERTQLSELLAAMIKAVAISTDEIHRLPDNYRALKATKTGDGLPLPGGPGFTLIGRDDGMAVAPIHLSYFPMSEFLVYLRLPPTGPTATEYIEATRIFSRSRAQVVSASARNPRGPNSQLDNCLLEGQCEPPQFPVDTETALVRRAILVSNEGEPVLSPITETVQLRQYRSIPDRHAAFERGNDPQVAEFRLSQRALLEGRPSLRRVADDEKGFSTFGTQGFDFFFEPASPETLSLQSQGVRFGPSRVLAACQACHQNPGVGSFTTYSRMQFEPAERQFILLHASTEEQEAAAALRDLKASATWKLLHAMMH